MVVGHLEGVIFDVLDLMDVVALSVAQAAAIRTLDDVPDDVPVPILHDVPALSRMAVMNGIVVFHRILRQALLRWQQAVRNWIANDPLIKFKREVFKELGDRDCQVPVPAAS